MTTRKPRSFLYDDYMDNTMYADEIPARRSVRKYRPLNSFADNDDETVAVQPRGRGAMTARSDPIYGADGSVYVKPNVRRRPHSTRSINTIRVTGGGRGRRSHPAYSLLDDQQPRRSRFGNRPRVREEVIEVCSFISFLEGNRIFSTLQCVDSIQSNQH